MARGYASFVVRCWQLRNGQRRIKVEHMQSGDQTQVTTLDAALAWIAAHEESATTAERDAETDSPAGPGGA